MTFPAARRRNALRALVLALALARPARASFESPFVTGQSAALGYSSVTRAKDPAALFANPALAARMGGAEAYFTYANHFAGLEGAAALNTGFMAGGVPYKGGSILAGVGTFDAGGLLQERTVSVGYARGFGRLQLGVAAKHLSHSYRVDGDSLAQSDPVFRSGKSAGALAVDAGAAYEFSESVLAGVSVRNLNSPDVGLAAIDRVPRMLQGGAAVKIADGWRLFADVSHQDDGEFRRLIPAGGVEKSFYADAVAFRVGASATELTGGVGVRYGRLEFDYALVLRRSLVSDNFGSHTIGLRLKFGGPSVR